MKKLFNGTCMYNIIKSVFSKKKKHSLVNVKQSTVFSLNGSFKNTRRFNWEIQVDGKMTNNIIK